MSSLPLYHLLFILGCGGLNKNGPNTLLYLNTWLLVGGYLGERLGGMVLIEEVSVRVSFKISYHPQVAPSASCVYIKM